jgi:hypothetical protein
VSNIFVRVYEKGEIRQILVKLLSIKFHENPSSGNRDISCAHAERRADGRNELKDMMKLVAAFRKLLSERA